MAMAIYVGILRYRTAKGLGKTKPYDTESEAQAAVTAEMENDSNIMEGYVARLLSKSIREREIITTQIG
jgi:hypothetical protein